LRLERLPTEEDRLEVFGILEVVLKVDDDGRVPVEATLRVEK
jgi:hypothetical protein